MNTLALPHIEAPIAPPSAAGAFDRAGAQVGQAADKWAGVTAEAQQAQTAVQMQEATLQHTAALDKMKNTVRDNPYVTPDQVKSLFGGNVPSGVKLTESVAVPGSDQPVDQPRQVIPMHEISPLLFDQAAKAALDNSAGNIEAKGFREKFQEAAAADTEKAREEVLGWQRAQMQADAHIRTVAQLEQAAAARNWPLYKTILATPQNLLDVKARTELTENLPRLMTKANIEDRLRARTPEELNGVLRDIDLNTVDKEKNGFYAKLNAEEQLHYTTMAHRRLNEVQSQQDRMEKRAEEQRFEAFGNQVQQAVNASRQTGAPLSSFISVLNIPSDIKWHEKQNMMNFIDAMSKKERATDNRVWAQLSDAKASGELQNFTVGKMMSFWPGLSEEHQRHWMDVWSAAQAGRKGPADVVYTENTTKLIHEVLSGFYKVDPKKDPDRFNALTAHVQQNLEAWAAKNPNQPLNYATVRTEARLGSFSADTSGSVFGLFGTNSEKAWLGKYFPNGDAVGALSTLSLGLHAAMPGRTVSDQDLRTHTQQMEQEKPDVTEAWNKLIGPNAALDGIARAAVHSVLINPTELKRVDAALAVAGLPATQKNRVFQVVKDMQPPQASEYAQKQEADARTALERQQVQRAGVELKAVRDAETAAEKAQREAADKAEKARFTKLPFWEQRAELNSKSQWEQQESDIRSHIAERVYAEDYARQQAAKASGKTAYTIGNRLSDDPVRIEMEKRIDAEAAKDRETRRVNFDAQSREGRAAYRVYFEKNMMNEDGSVKTWAPPGFIDNYDTWLKLRREGKVP